MLGIGNIGKLGRLGQNDINAIVKYKVTLTENEIIIE